MSGENDFLPITNEHESALSAGLLCLTEQHTSFSCALHVRYNSERSCAGLFVPWESCGAVAYFQPPNKKGTVLIASVVHEAISHLYSKLCVEAL